MTDVKKVVKFLTKVHSADTLFTDGHYGFTCETFMDSQGDRGNLLIAPVPVVREWLKTTIQAFGSDLQSEAYAAEDYRVAASTAVQLADDLDSLDQATLDDEWVLFHDGFLSQKWAG